jgi:ribonuclease HI
MDPVVVYTDGSGTRAHLPCGAGVVVYDGDPVLTDWALEPAVEASRHLGLGSNNHAELSAIRVALYVTSFPPFAGRFLLIRSDSEYAIKMCGWRGSLDPERPNAKLVEVIRRELRGRAVRFEHVLSHAGIPGNERADELAGMARLKTWKVEPQVPAPPDERLAFARILSELRKAAKLSPSAVADKLGIMPLRIQNMEAGVAPPPSDLMIRVLARALRVDLEPLIEAARITRSAKENRTADERTAS